MATRCASARSSCSTVSFRPSSMFQITSGLSRSRFVRSSAALRQRKIERAQHVEAFMRLAQIGMRFLDDGASFRKALRGLAGDGRDFRIDRRDAEIGRIGDALRLACRSARPARNEFGSTGSDSGSAGCSPLMASSSSARSSTLRAIGPCRPRLRSIAAASVCATRPMLGRRPTMPQKLAGLRKLPPMSEPCASQAMPVASATAAPPEEPAAERRRVPRIERRAEHFVEGVGAGAEFRRVRLRVDDAAIVFEMLDQDVGLRRDVILVDRRALRGSARPRRR